MTGEGRGNPSKVSEVKLNEELDQGEHTGESCVASQKGRSLPMYREARRE